MPEGILNVRHSNNLARFIQCKKVFVIFEQSERPALHGSLFSSEKVRRIHCRFFASLKNDGCLFASG